MGTRDARSTWPRVLTNPAATFVPPISTPRIKFSDARTAPRLRNDRALVSVVNCVAAADAQKKPRDGTARFYGIFPWRVAIAIRRLYPGRDSRSAGFSKSRRYRIRRSGYCGIKPKINEFDVNLDSQFF